MLPNTNIKPEEEKKPEKMGRLQKSPRSSIRPVEVWLTEDQIDRLATFTAKRGLKGFSAGISALLDIIDRINANPERMIAHLERWIARHEAEAAPEEEEPAEEESAEEEPEEEENAAPAPQPKTRKERRLGIKQEQRARR